VIVEFIIESDIDSITDIDPDELEDSLTKKLTGDFMGAPILSFESQVCYLTPIKLVR
jgi:hypothetical protein